MIYYIWSLAVHSAVLSYVLISTVSYIALCYALTRTHTYSPLWSTTHNDPHLSNFVEEEFLTEQVEAIKELGDHITKLNRAGSGLGEYLYDKELQSK